VRSSSIAATTASTSRPSTREIACKMSASWSSRSVVVNQPSCSARSTSSSRPGNSSRAATIVRHAREEAVMRERGCVSRGIP
jgi:hypothetical protein